jgi:putative transposase
VADEQSSAELAWTVDELVREGAGRMLAVALEAYVSSFAEQVDETGKRLVVRNGHSRPRRIVTGAGPVECSRRG